ncbi:MAG TPA: hypothetical protein ENN28_03775 [Candidatus Uhrbacteria bacterium]|nr:hypothetical protein [Candidatus Uhrbacteria bacterium]
MKKSGTVFATLGQIKDIISVLVQAIPTTLTKEAAQKIISNKGKLIKAIGHAFQEIIGANGCEEMLSEWARFYKEVFGLEADFTDLQLPEEREGFNWLLVMLQGLTPNKLFDKCKERFSAWRYTEDLDAITSDRQTDRTYAIRLRDREEADEENKNKSANTCKAESIIGITLPERLLLELFYHWRTGKHLDINNVTLCSGSRNPDGDVPNVSWDDDRLFVYYYSRDGYNGGLRARAAVA